MKRGLQAHLPNFITCLNLVSGSLGIVFLLHGSIDFCAITIVASLLFDFLDGFIARLLNAQSPIGKQLDSLADMVTFGLLPGLIMQHLFQNSYPFMMVENSLKKEMISAFPLIITVFSALRLAKFNLDTRQNDGFIGLPTPASTIFIAGLALALEHDRFALTPVLNNTWILAGISLLLCWLLVSELPMIALKFKKFGLHDNLKQYLLIVSALLLVLFLGVTGVPLVIVLYITLSLGKPQSAEPS